MNPLATIGASAILAAFAAALVAVGASVYGQRARRAAGVRVGRRALVSAALLTTTAVIALAYALLANEFAIAHVASVSSSEMQPHMKWASIYSGQPGSLLFWTWTMSLFMAGATLWTVPKIPWAAPHAVATMGTVLAAFLFALVFMASPFELSPVEPPDGVGLNPLLVDPGMLVHPPMLLTGLTSTSIPFALGAAALLAGRVDGEWIRHARNWALVSFVVLSVGNILGGWWAYTVLGWGGYWGWDPVENSAILPLLPLIAFLHTMAVQERRGMLKLWNLVLVFAAFALAVFGTFNVRSGLVASVHSFAQSDVGPYFLSLLGLTLLASVALFVWRLPILRGEYEYESLLSRETGLIVNSYVFIAMALVILGGTLFPVFSELIEGVRITVGPPFFDDVVGPLLIVMLGLIAVTTALPWRRGTPAAIVRRVRAPLALTLMATIALVTLGLRDPFALVTVVAALSILAVTGREYWSAARGRRRASGRSWPVAFASLFQRDQRRYGGYLVHIGIAVMAIAVVASTVYQQQVRAVLAPGESFEVGRYDLTFEGLEVRNPGVNGIGAEQVALVTVREGDDVVGRLEPGQRFFRNFPEQPTAMVSILGSWREDLYTFLQGQSDGTVELQGFVNPLVRWLWLGAAIFAIGGFLTFAPLASPAPARREAPAAAERA